MSSAPRNLPAVACAENVALLYALHKVPKQPSKIDPDLLPTTWPGDYRLSFDEERQISSAFAFVSSISDNSDTVTAVCIQEQHGRQDSLKLLLAMNRKCHGDGQDFVNTIKSGLEDVVEPLKSLDRRPEKDEKILDEPTIETSIFTAIVEMCENRILCRVRLVPNSRGIPKQSLKTTLQRAIDSLRERKNDEKVDDTFNLSQILARMRAVIKLLDVWSRYQVTSRVQELVEGIYRLSRTAGLYEAINAIPNVDLAPDLRKSLINIVRKVARHREIARLLYRTAKDTTPMLRRTSVVVVDLPPAAYTKVKSRQDYVPDIVAKIDEAGTGQNHSEQEMDMLFRHLDTDRTAAAQAFGRQTRNTLAQSKIHAEIQLVEYCNSSMAKEPPPRVVRSNKDACYLCSIFIQTHSKLYTSRSHGTLYPFWRLPRTLDASVQKAFNNTLAKIIRESIDKLKDRKEKSSYPQPNESTLTSIPSLRSRTSVLSSTSTDDNSKGKDVVDSQRIDHNKSSEEAGKESVTIMEVVPEAVLVATSQTNDEPLHQDPLPVPSEPNTLEKHTKVGISTSSISSLPEASVESILNTTESSQGTDGMSENVDGISQTKTPTFIVSGHVQQGQTSAMNYMPPFEIQLEYAKDVLAEDGNGGELCFMLQHLAADDVVRLQNGKVAVVDVEKQCFGDEVSCKLDDLGCLYISAQGSFLRMSLVLSP